MNVCEIGVEEVDEEISKDDCMNGRNVCTRATLQPYMHVQAWKQSREG